MPSSGIGDDGCLSRGRRGAVEEHDRGARRIPQVGVLERSSVPQRHRREHTAKVRRRGPPAKGGVRRRRPRARQRGRRAPCRGRRCRSRCARRVDLVVLVRAIDQVPGCVRQQRLDSSPRRGRGALDQAIRWSAALRASTSAKGTPVCAPSPCARSQAAPTPRPGRVSTAGTRLASTFWHGFDLVRASCVRRSLRRSRRRFAACAEAARVERANRCEAGAAVTTGIALPGRRAARGRRQPAGDA